jgi:hypothetical protein
MTRKGARADGSPITRDETLLWLNDRLGRDVGVVLAVDRGEFSTLAVHVEGPLRHWCEDAQLGGPGSDRRDDLSVGSMRSEHEPRRDRAWRLSVRGRDHRDNITFELANDVVLTIDVPMGHEPVRPPDIQP